MNRAGKKQSVSSDHEKNQALYIWMNSKDDLLRWEPDYSGSFGSLLWHPGSGFPLPREAHLFQRLHKIKLFRRPLPDSTTITLSTYISSPQSLQQGKKKRHLQPKKPTRWVFCFQCSTSKPMQSSWTGEFFGGWGDNRASVRSLRVPQTNSVVDHWEQGRVKTCRLDNMLQTGGWECSIRQKSGICFVYFAWILGSINWSLLPNGGRARCETVQEKNIALFSLALEPYNGVPMVYRKDILVSNSVQIRESNIKPHKCRLGGRKETDPDRQKYMANQESRWLLREEFLRSTMNQSWIYWNIPIYFLANCALEERTLFHKRLKSRRCKTISSHLKWT